MLASASSQSVGIGADALALRQTAARWRRGSGCRRKAARAGLVRRRPEAGEGARPGRPSSTWVRSSKAKSSPKAAVSTAAAAPDCVLWPLGYSGKGGVISSDSHFGSIVRRMIGDGADEVVFELRVPAADEGIRQRDAKTGQHIDAGLESAPRCVEDLQRDRDPVAGRGRRQHRIVRPEPRDRRAARRSAWPADRKPPSPRRRRPRPGLRCRRAAAAGRRRRRRAWRRCGCCPSRAAAAPAAGAIALVGTQAAGLAVRRVG